LILKLLKGETKKVKRHRPKPNPIKDNEKTMSCQPNSTLYWSIRVLKGKGKFYIITKKDATEYNSMFKDGDIVFAYDVTTSRYVAWGCLGRTKICKVPKKDKLPYSDDFGQYMIKFKFNKANIIPLKANEQGYFTPTDSFPLHKLKYGPQFLKKINKYMLSTEE
jgi:hypothetical protein